MDPISNFSTTRYRRFYNASWKDETSLPYALRGNYTAIILVGKFCMMCWEESWDYLTVVPNLFCWEYLLLFRRKVGKILFFPTKIPTLCVIPQLFSTDSTIFPTSFPQHNFPVLGFSTLAELFCWEFRIGHVMESNQSSFTSLVFHISRLCSLYLYLLNAQRSYASTS
jgi:hypothetical protein